MQTDPASTPDKSFVVRLGIRGGNRDTLPERTENAPYPPCQLNFESIPPRLFTQPDEFAFALRITSDMLWLRLREQSTCTWSLVPPTSSAGQSSPVKTRAR